MWKSIAGALALVLGLGLTATAASGEKEEGEPVVSSVPRRDTLPRKLQDYERRISNLEKLIGQTAVSNIGVQPVAQSTTKLVNVTGGGHNHVVTVTNIPDWAKSVTVVAVGTASFSPGAPLVGASTVISIEGETNSGSSLGFSDHALTNQHGRKFSVEGLSSYNVSLLVGFGDTTPRDVQFMVTILSIYEKEPI